MNETKIKFITTGKVEPSVSFKDMEPYVFYLAVGQPGSFNNKSLVFKCFDDKLIHLDDDGITHSDESYTFQEYTIYELDNSKITVKLDL